MPGAAVTGASAGVPPPLRVAIADDHEDLCVVLAELIDQTAGLACVVRLTRRADVVAAVRSSTPDVLVLDLMLGGLSSLPLLPDILAGSPRTRVVIHSGHDIAALAADATRRGAVAYVAKSGDPDELLEAIRRAGGDGS